MDRTRDPAGASDGSAGSNDVAGERAGPTRGGRAAGWLEPAASTARGHWFDSPSPALATANPGSRLAPIVFVCAPRSCLVWRSVPPRPGARGSVPGGDDRQDRVRGNATIPAEKIKPKLLSRVGQPLDQEKAEADLKTLLGTKWFSDARYFFDETPPKSGKYTLTFPSGRCPCSPRLNSGGGRHSAEGDRGYTGLKAGNRADPDADPAGGRPDPAALSEKGYDLASVTLLEGGNTGDTKS